ncbi:hypothetical protein ACQ4PT_072078 [Festuca glaucescens]
MIQLEIAREGEVISEETLQAYLRYFEEKPMTAENLTACLALFGWLLDVLPVVEDGDVDLRSRPPTWLSPSLGVCHASGYLPGKAGKCERSNDPDWCEDGKRYPQYHCSPPVTAATKAVLTLNSFEKGKDGGGPSECDKAYHSDKEMVVALSTGWFKKMARCGHKIKITANGKSVYAKVVDKCDSVYVWDGEHNYKPPCDNNIVDASPAVWNALGLDQNVEV